VKSEALKVKQQTYGSDPTEKKLPLFSSPVVSFHLQLDKGDHLTNSNTQCSTQSYRISSGELFLHNYMLCSHLWKCKVSLKQRNWYVTIYW